ncbi:M1 family aminopeptidase [Dyadobacter sp. CY312]|uniref:ABC transporter permease/M1 family aminopeptidase n=1 Tax=Dyadobacter sp. CY312 TaxID=2907303 RepID=UPI001F1E9238|nr:M1 family aminopeptidase [Dyadobacter sp. CY312]MCE7041418.1 aminopeptidase [Dyadobacter sp. CY312]
MWKHIALFEWQYRRKRPATYLYFGILFLISFLFVATDAVEMFSGGQIKQNATSAIAGLTSAMSLICIFVISAIMGVSIVRDFEHRTEALFFTAPIAKVNYLFGRFLGSFLILLLVLTGIPLGLMLGEFMPWRDADKLLPFRAMSYWNPFVLIVISNAFIMGSIFFMVGALSRRMIVVFTQGMMVLLLYLLSMSLVGKLDNKEFAAILDPMGMAARSYTTQYWSIAEKNASLIPFSGIFLQNRLVWLGLGLLALVATHLFFTFDQVKDGFIKKKAALDREEKPFKSSLLKPNLVFGGMQEVRNVFSMAIFYFRNTVLDIPFISLVLCGLAFSVFSVFQSGDFYGAKSLPTTYFMLDKLGMLTGVFGFIIMVLYVGNLVWMERDKNFDLIHDAIPRSQGSVLLGKYFGLALTFILMFAGAILIMVALQVILGGADLVRWDVYIKTLYGESLISMLIWMMLGFFIQVIVNNKFAGYALLIIVFMSNDMLSYLDVEHIMVRFDSGSLATISDMNGFGDSAVKYGWLKSYWGALSIILFVAAIVLSVRGSEEKLTLRWKTGKYRITRSLTLLGITMLAIFASTGAYVYYNTNVLNKFSISKEEEKDHANHEIALKKYENMAQPKITEISLAVDLRPETRDFSAKGYYILKNKTSESIKDIHIHIYPDEDVELKGLSFSVVAKEDKQYADKFNYHIYRLDKPMQPGDSLRMDFDLDYETTGFKNGASNPSVVFNGTFIDNNFFPHIGYSSSMELSEDDKRKEQGLKPKERLRPQTDPIAVKQSVISGDADEIKFEITVSTVPDQIALAPGYLTKSWKQKDSNGSERQYFKYQMDAPMANFYTIVSARYLVKKEVYKGINLEIYYHPGHEYNLNRMMQGMKASLDYYQDNYGPYQSKQMRIMEYPRYRDYAQSFANTVPFSESMGFMLDINDKNDIDVPFYVTAHEMAHQWWAHQVTEASVQGGAMLSESLAEYSALMVMGKVYSKEKMQKFLEHELNSYLRGRSGERKKEQPLNKVEGQAYIHYYKGAHVLYALQDQIGESTLNSAFKSYLQKWNVGNLEKNGRYPVTSDLITEIRKVTPDSLQYLVTDLLETITLFDNKADKVTVKQQGKQYAVTLDYSAQKLRADSLGNETPVKLNDWVWIGVFGKDGEKKDDKLLYYQRYKINKEKGSVTVMVKEKPTKAGIDPLNLLIDRHVKDNVKVVE